jgi:hypothetical protein
VGFLCTRVKGPTEEDEKKLSRLLSYLNGSKDQVMKLKPLGIFKVEAFVDASFTVHPDEKSHSGIVIQVGGVSMECRWSVGVFWVKEAEMHQQKPDRGGIGGLVRHPWVCRAVCRIFRFCDRLRSFKAKDIPR